MTDHGVDEEPRSWEETLEVLAREVRRVADRLRGLSQARLAAEVQAQSSLADAARATAQALADVAQGIEERRRADEPIWRALPTLGDFAVGDQLMVTGQDLLAAAVQVGADEPVWARGSRRTSGQVLAAAAADVAELRRVL
jgi:hypothetical protein